MKKIIQTSLSILTTLVLVMSLSGCGANKAESELSFISPIDGWGDITLPEESTFIRTNISGKVENHEYMTTLEEAELLNFAEKAMESQGWIISSSESNGRSFLKNEDAVHFTAKPSTEGGTPLFIIIEPKDAYGASEEVTE
jgi:hypothetical protein